MVAVADFVRTERGPQASDLVMRQSDEAYGFLYLSGCRGGRRLTRTAGSMLKAGHGR